MEIVSEKITVIQLLGFPNKFEEAETVKLAYYSEEERELIMHSNFVSPGNEPNGIFNETPGKSPGKITSFMNLDKGHHVIGIWEFSEDDKLYRLKARIESSSDYTLKIKLRKFNRKREWDKEQFAI